MANPGEHEPPGGPKDFVSAPPSPPGGAASSSPGGPASTPPSLSAVFRDLHLLLDAQWRIWRLRARGRFVGMCLAAAFFLAIMGLGAWGFVLFDRALDLVILRALSTPSGAASAIASPLIRALLYLGGAGWGFHAMYVYGSEDEEILPPEPPE